FKAGRWGTTPPTRTGRTWTSRWSRGCRCRSFTTSTPRDTSDCQWSWYARRPACFRRWPMPAWVVRKRRAWGGERSLLHAGPSVLLYQKAARAENPIRCVEFENTTGLTLEGGPVTVLEAGSYVGEAMLDTMKPTEKRLVGYAVELAVRVLDNIDTHSDRVNRVTIRNAVSTTRSSH